MRKKRHNYTPEEKVSILRRHLVEHVVAAALLTPSERILGGAEARLRDAVGKEDDAVIGLHGELREAEPPVLPLWRGLFLRLR